MDNKRKNRWRKQESERIRQQRVINGYIERKYPEIYGEAVDFYKFLDEKYPQKKDLRRTNEYEWLKTGISGQTTKKFYARKENTTRTTTTTTTTVVNDQMELVIPLMTKSTTKSKSSTSQPQADEQSPVETQLPVETQQSVATQPPVETQPPLEPVEIVIDNTSTFEPMLHEDIPDQIIKEIMSGLYNDPYLEDFFLDIDTEFDEESPLERELKL